MKRLTCVLVLVMSCLCLFAAPRPVVALVLSGGGARGFAHIPIIEELERRGIVPDMVIGASMGALVGALYASGYTSQDMYALIDDTDFMNAVFNLSQPAEKVLDRAYDSIGDPNFSIDFTEDGIGRTDALLDDSKVNLILHEALSRVEDIGSFDDLAIPFRCVGTDFRSGEGIVFSSGSLYDALRASMSMPFVFPVVQLEDGRYVVDGGVYDSRAFAELVQRELGLRHVGHVRVPVVLLHAVCAAGESWGRLTRQGVTLNLDKFRILKQRNWQCDISPIQRDLGFCPRYSLEQGVKETVAWYKQEKWL